MNESSYTAWDDNLYEWPPPDGWYQASDGKWWPDGYGPGVDVGTDETVSDIIDTAETDLDEIAEAISHEPEPTAIYPAGGGLDSLPTTGGPAETEHQRPVYDELPPIDDVFGGQDPFADDESVHEPSAAESDDQLDVHLPPLDSSAGSEIESEGADGGLVGGLTAGGGIEEGTTIDPAEVLPVQDDQPTGAGLFDDTSIGAGVDEMAVSGDHPSDGAIDSGDASAVDPGPFDDTSIGAGVDEMTVSGDHPSDGGIDSGDALAVGADGSGGLPIGAGDGSAAGSDQSGDLAIGAGDESAAGADDSGDLPIGVGDESAVGVDDSGDIAIGVGDELTVGDEQSGDITIDPADDLLADAVAAGGVTDFVPDSDRHIPGEDVIDRLDQAQLDAKREELAPPSSTSLFDSATAERQPVPAAFGEGAVSTFADLDDPPALGSDGPAFGSEPPALYDGDVDDGGHRPRGEPTSSATLWPLFIVGIVAALLVLLAVAFFVFRDTGDDTATEDPAESIPAVGLGSIGQPYDFGTGVVVFYDAGGQQRRWVVQVLSPVADGTEEFAALADGVAPLDGDVLAFSRVRVTYQSGPTPGQLVDLRLNAVGTSSTRYSHEDDRCVAASDQLILDAELEPSESVEGNLCWEISAADLSDLKLAIEAGPADGTVHLSLN